MAVPAGHWYEFGDFRLEPEKLRLWHGGELVQLRPKAIEILLLLVSNPDRTVLRDEILETVWKDTFVEEGNINFNVSLIRKALAEGNWEQGAPIATVPKAGYRFVADVREVGLDKEPAMDVAGSVLVAEARGYKVRWHFLALAFGALFLLTSFTLLTRVDIGSAGTAPSTAGRQFRSMAVLPLRQIGDDPALKLTGLGITDQMISKLGSSGGFTVRPFSAVEKFEQSGLESVDFGRTLKVDVVIEGTIQSGGDRLRLSVRMFDVRDGAILWSESFEEPSSDLFVLQDKLAENVARTLRVSLSGDSSAKYALNSEAYQSYLRGRFFFDKRDKEGFKKARAEFERAIAIDPKFALAYSGLADVYMLQLEHDATRNESFRNARINALKALEIDDSLAESHTSLAWIYRMQDWNWEASERHFKRAIEINPNYLNSRQWYAMLLTTVGRFDEALVQIEKAREIDPLSAVVLNNFTAIAIYRRDSDLIRKVAALRSDLAAKETDRLRDLAIALDRVGDHDQALPLAEQLKELNGGKTDSKSVDARLVVQYQRLGRVDESKTLLRELESKLPGDTFVAYHLAMTYADLGRYSEAVKMLQLCFDAHDPRLLWIKVEPRFDPLRRDPQFRKILLQMRLSE